MVRLPGRVRLGVLVISLVLAALALRLAWGLHGPELFVFGFEARAQEEFIDCPDGQVVSEFSGDGDQLTENFDTPEAFRVTYDLRSAGLEEPSMDIVAFDRDGVRSLDAFQDGEGTGESRVNDSPGTYYLDIETTGDADYTVTVEQCQDTGSGGQNDDDVSTQRSSNTRLSQTAQRDQPNNIESDNPDEGLDEDPAADEDEDPSEEDEDPVADEDEDPASEEDEDNPPRDRSLDEDRDRDRGGERRRLLEAGGPQEGPVPAMPDGRCPDEFPTAQDGSCYR